jgi:hypothetical protein
MKHQDPRLERIRLYQGSIKDLQDFIKSKEAETKAAQGSIIPNSNLKDQQ